MGNLKANNPLSIQEIEDIKTEWRNRYPGIFTEKEFAILSVGSTNATNPVDIDLIPKARQSTRCLYCGRKSRGWVCPGCGASL